MVARNFTPIHDLIRKQNGSPNKEFMPSSPPAETIDLAESVEHEIEDKNVSQIIEVKPDAVIVPNLVKKAGVVSIAAPTFSTYKNLKLPVDEAKIPAGLNAPVDTSYRWLATLAQYIINQSHKHMIRAHRSVRSFLSRG
jgi:hypothetical protein